MRHFSHLPAGAAAGLFHRPPGEFDRTSPPEVLAQALGATLYVPGTRPDLAEVIRRRVASGVRSMVIDLEDAVRDDQVDAALDNTVAALGELTDADLLLFVRPRAPEQIGALAQRLGPALSAVCGFVAPKFTPENGEAYLAALDDVGPDLLY